MNLKELAERLNLSQTTVSRALNGYPEVSEATRLRVVEMARKHNYHPNSHAAQLATGKANAIGHVLTLSDHNVIDPHFADFIAGAGEHYAQTGYDCLISVVPAGEEEAVYRRLARTKRVDGVVLHGPLVSDWRIRLLRELGLPFIVHGRTGDDPDSYSWLDVNNKRAFQRATRHLVDLGHRRIALINGIEQMTFAHRRRAGFELALAECSLAADPALMSTSVMSEPNGHAAMARLLVMPERPTAVLTASVLLAMGAVRAIQEAGLSPGRDISLITFDDCLSFLPNDPGEPVLTSLRSSIRAAGRRVAELLLRIVSEPQAAPLHELWEADLVIGRSTGPVPVRGG